MMSTELPDDLAGFVEQGTGLQGWEVVETRAGDVNRIYTLRHPQVETDLVLRHRIGHATFRYEQSLPKDAAAQALLTGQWQPGDALDVQELPEHNLLPHSLHWTVTRPDALSLQHHIAGPTFAEAGEIASWGKLGVVMAELHALDVPHWAARLDGSGAVAADFQQHITDLLAAELPEAESWLPEGAAVAIAALAPQGHEVAPRLLHNDVHGDNVIACATRGAVLVDWDNACIGAPELDWVKLRFFPLLDGEPLSHRTSAHDRALEGYLAAGADALNTDRLHLYGLLWQMRLGNFQRSRGDVAVEVQRAVELLLGEL